MHRLLFFILLCRVLPATTQVPVPPTHPLEKAFSLDELQRRTFYFFWDLADVNAQIPDRWPTVQFSSIAATGFGLSSYLIGVERGWVTRQDAAERTLRTLNILKSLPQGDAIAGTTGYHGFFYHFLDHTNSHRYKDVELSTIDSGLLLAGILSAQTYFDGNNATEKAIRESADFIYRRVEWDWMLNQSDRLSMGWKPERGFLNAEWWGYNEAMILYILALGSPTHPIPESAWDAWTNSYYVDQFQGQEHLNFGPLFGHQYSHTWIDFKGISDPFNKKSGFDYFENSRRATISNRLYCIENPGKFKGYQQNVWGLTACDGPADWFSKYDPTSKCSTDRDRFKGYNARGVATDYAEDDGTIAPTAAGGSLPFAPEICLPALETMWQTYYDSLIGPYGFKDAFNPSFTACGQLPEGWFDTDYLGIDQGPILLMIENYRTGFLWNLMKRNPYIVKGLQKAGFDGGWLEHQPKSRLTAEYHTQRNEEIPQDPKPFFERHIYRESASSSLPYRLVTPSGMPHDFKPSLNPTDKLPLVIFLHGSGERGNNNEAQLSNGVLAFVEKENYQKNPCFIIAPQCPNDQRWCEVKRPEGPVFQPQPTEPMRLLIKVLEKILIENPQIDPNRIYITGLSMGGFGTFDLVNRLPDLFAAAMPLCGGYDTSQSKNFQKIPFWILHGRRDDVVPPQWSLRMVNAMKTNKSTVKYTEYNTLGHSIWQETYYNPAVMEWIFSQKKQ